MKRLLQGSHTNALQLRGVTKMPFKEGLRALLELVKTWCLVVVTML